jgi:ABC-type multidrug transport system fused ATPase/permease subunit
MLLYISVEMTIICLLVAGIALYFLNFLIVHSKELGKKAVDASMQLNEFISERLNLVKLIKIFSTEDSENRSFGAVTCRYARENTAFMFNGIKIETIFQIIIFSIAIAILYVSSFVFDMPLALLLVFIFILIRLTDPLRQLNSQRHQLAGELAGLEKIDHILEESSKAKTLTDGQIKFEGFSKSIRFKGVTFSYTSLCKTLDNISFEVPKYAMVALVGASGGGKSTIVDLMIHLLEPETGSILIDDTDIREYAIESYHKKIGFVSQESYLFNDTVLNNICYGAEQCDMDKAVPVAKIANAHEFISGLPDGYNTIIGERGVKLSGGQKQRIALARALYKKPELLILDEATSSLDSESEKVIQESIAGLKHKYTIVAIAHRLSTIENADFIIVIEKGTIVETGTHDDLLKAGGMYARYNNLQYRKEYPGGDMPDRDEPDTIPGFRGGHDR